MHLAWVLRDDSMEDPGIARLQAELVVGEQIKHLAVCALEAYWKLSCEVQQWSSPSDRQRHPQEKLSTQVRAVPVTLLRMGTLLLPTCVFTIVKGQAPK